MQFVVWIWLFKKFQYIWVRCIQQISALIEILLFVLMLYKLNYYCVYFINDAFMYIEKTFNSFLTFIILNLVVPMN